MSQSMLDDLVRESAVLLNECSTHLWANLDNAAVEAYGTDRRDEMLAGPWGDNPVTEAVYGATAYLAAAAEQLLSSLGLVAGPSGEWPLWSVDPLLRSAAEASARSWFVMGTTGDDLSLVCRWMNEHVYSASQFASLSALAPTPLKPAITQARIHASAELHGIALYKSTPYLKEPRPTSTDLFRKLLTGPRYEWTFRSLSAGPHAVTWSILGRLPDQLPVKEGSLAAVLRVVNVLAPLLDVTEIFQMAFARWLVMMQLPSHRWATRWTDWNTLVKSTRSQIAFPEK